MSKAQRKAQEQKKQARLEIVAQLYKRGYSIRSIRAEVMKRLDLPTYSTRTVHNDIGTLLDEWRDSRISDMNDALELELARIDDTVRELWEQWEKSKTDYTRTATTRKGAPANRRNSEGDGQNERPIQTYAVENKQEQVVRLGDPSYISEIRAQLAERRKLLGLYAPEKKDIQGSMSFATFLMESGVIDDEEQQGTGE